jgi:hypothetical protein
LHTCIDGLQSELLGSDPVRGQTPETPDRMGEFEARLARLEAAFDDLRAQSDA